MNAMGIMMQVLHFMLGEKNKGTHSSMILKEI